MFSVSFWLPVIIVAGINAIVALGVYTTLLSGQLSVGHAAFMGLGAYTAAVLTTNFKLPFLTAILAGMLVGLVTGALLGLVTLRMSELVVGLTTIGFGETLVVLAFNIDYIGGAQSFSGIPLKTNLPVVAAALAAVVYFTWRLDRSRIGFAARAIRDSPGTAASMGIHVPRIRILTFSLGAMIAGLGGALSAHYNLVVNPSDMGFFHSLTFLIYVVVGGSYTYWGPVLGAFILTLAPEVLRILVSISDALSLSLRIVAYGLVLALIVLVRPEGILTRTPTGRESRGAALLQRAWGRRKSSTPAPATPLERTTQPDEPQP